MYQLTNIGPNSEWKIKKAREQFPDLPLVHRDYPMTMGEANYAAYDEGVALMNDLHSIGFTRDLTDQESFEFWQFWYRIK